jgi:PiT family inorganic phosphate transporter
MVSLELVILIVVFGLLFDYTNGFHDAANVVSTVIATRVLAPLTAICMAAVLNTIGATQISGVAETVSTGLVRAAEATQVMVLAALVGAILWNLLTWYLGIPSSSSYALIGGLVGAAWVSEGWQTIIWSGVMYKVVIPMVLSPPAGFLIGFIVLKILNFYIKRKVINHQERLFARLQVLSAGFVALAHGLNDAQKSMGIITLGLFAGGILTTTHIPLWVILACALMMGLGTASGGWRIIRTVGYEITPLRPLQGFAAETSASCVILVASFLGMPISSTHMIVGSVTGVGVARAPGRVHWDVGKKMGIAWILTLPGAGCMASVVYKLIEPFAT